jgi:DNA end-binding protein Ku
MPTKKKSSPKNKSRSEKKTADAGNATSGRSLWSGSISFGLLNIPVSLGSAKEEANLSFQLLDKRDYGHIGYRQYNKTTGKEVPKDKIVKGYELQDGKFVIVDDDDFKRANPRAVSSIDIEDFVEYKEMDPMLFDTPYYLRPAKNGEKGYMLLRDVMKKEGKVAIGKVVLFRKQRLVAIIVRGEYLVLEMLRFD